MRNPPPRSWVASILGFALMVLAASAALRLAAEWLRQALPVLVPVSIVALVGFLGYRLWGRRHNTW